MRYRPRCVACLSDADVAALLDGTLAAEARAAVERELAECDACRQLVGACFSDSRDARGAATPPSATMPLGAVPARYRIDRVLGAGAMGVVFAGYDLDLARPVALKAHRQPDDPQARAQLIGEARALAAVRHPHVVAAYGYEQTATFAYLVMEFVDGESLAQRLRRGSVPWPEAVRLLADLADGLAALHAAGLLHRDLKPANILIDRAGAVRLADLGLARLQTADGSRAGTLPYMAPEVLRDGNASAASDQFGLAVVLWEALDGQRPFAGTTAGELTAAHARPLPAPAHARPRRLHRALVRALAPTPDARWPSMAALAAELRTIAAGPRRRRWILGTSAAVASAAAVVTAVTLVRRPPAAVDPRARAQLACARERGARRGLPGPPADAALLLAMQDEDSLDRCTVASPRRYLGASPRADRLRLAARDIMLGSAAEALARVEDLAIETIEPPLAATLAWTKARALVELGRMYEARQPMLTAATLALADDDRSLAATAYVELANIEGVGLDYVASARTFADTAARLARQAGDPLLLASAQQVTLMLYHAEGAPPDAVQGIDAAIATMRNLGVRIALARALRVRGRYRAATLQRDLAIADLGEAHALLAATLGPTHAQTLRARFNLVSARRRTSDDDGVQLARAHLAEATAALGPDAPLIDDLTKDLAAALRAHGDQAGALALLAPLVEKTARTRPFSDAAARDHYTLAITAMYDDAKLAEQHLRRAIEIWRVVLGPDHLRLVAPLGALAELIAPQGKLAEAQTLGDEAVAICTHRQHDGLQLAAALRSRAQVATVRGDLPQARTDVQQAITILERELAPDDPELGQLVGQLGETCLELQDLACAVPALTRARQLVRPVGFPDTIVGLEFLLARAAWLGGARATGITSAKAAKQAAPGAAPELLAAIDAWIAHPE